MNASTADETIAPHPLVGHILSAVGLFVIWMAATWLLEGRIHTFLRPEAMGARVAYALVVNILIAIGGAAILLRSLPAHGALQRRTPIGWSRGTPIAVLAGLVLGGALYAAQGAPTWEPIVLANAFAQAFVVSAAEVVVCWVVLGRVVRESLRGRNRVVAVIAGALVASVAFGVYHFAHSPPFNTWAMVALLTVVGLLTSAFYFASRDAWGTIVFHNMLALYGILGALAEQNALDAFRVIQVPLFVTAGVAAATLIAAHLWTARTRDR